MALQVPSQQLNWENRTFPIVVIAENIHSPTNVGMIIRICEAFGVQTLYFTGPYSNPSSKFKKASRSAEKYIEIIKDEDTVSVIQGLISQHFKIIALEITDESTSIAQFQVENGARLAILVGSERHGINDISLKLADTELHIEQFGKTGSLNVGTALSVALYELSKQMNSIATNE
ncbi:TrmH family RNA methyltransferase [Portibacter marinus]|uniref:TrmH family RNA methyltransferase n=1 Tax=Portibacter marinus TaxID=2898660 RepID=UPI0021D4234B|nr:TrmH family RNA methyltransferase [Portibacter marinus]